VILEEHNPEPQRERNRSAKVRIWELDVHAEASAVVAIAEPDGEVLRNNEIVGLPSNLLNWKSSSRDKNSSISCSDLVARRFDRGQFCDDKSITPSIVDAQCYQQDRLLLPLTEVR
jgi:hypothetical protein